MDLGVTIIQELHSEDWTAIKIEMTVDNNGLEANPDPPTESKQ